MSAPPPLTLEEFLSHHPWPAARSPDSLGPRSLPGAPPSSRARTSLAAELAHAAVDAPRLEWLWPVRLRADPDRLWAQIVDTSRLNRTLGLSQLRFRERDGQLHGSAVAAGLRQEWVELPWDWVEARCLSAARSYQAGLAHFVRVIYRFEPTDDGHLWFYAYFGWVPRGWWRGLLIRLGMKTLRARFEAVLHDLAAASVEGRTAIAPPPVDVPAGGRRRLAQISEQLVGRGVDAGVVEQLTKLVLRGDPHEVYRLQPRRLAHLWGVPERKVTGACLHATRVGLLDLRWDVICPHCRGVREELRELGEVPRRSACAPCQIEFGTSSENAIEITFRVHPSVRSVERSSFCSAQAEAKRHIKVQQVLEPGEVRTLQTCLERGRYRLRVTGASAVTYLDAVDGGEGTVRYRFAAPPEELVSRAEPTLELVNDTGEVSTFVLEDVNWADDALRPAHLFNHQEFRDLFSEQYVGADVHLEVGEITVLFTDIVGSTRMYVDRGDPEAFVKVRHHFAEVHDLVRAHDGAVVKTIGDATMAAFSDAAQALEAAHAIQQRALAGAAAGAVQVRISLNTGVCIAVNLNSNIDYFGTTVNCAAKLQACAGAGDIVLSRATREAPGVEAVLERHGADVGSQQLELAALDHPLTVYCWRVRPPAVAPPVTGRGP